MKQCKYQIKGTLRVACTDESYNSRYADGEILDFEEEIKAIVERNEPELSRYIPQGHACYGVITEIKVDVKRFRGELVSWTEVIATQELNEYQKFQLLEYITGQFSDGFGEGLEQQPFLTETIDDTREEWNEEEQEVETVPCSEEIQYFAHLWTADDFTLEFVDPIDAMQDEFAEEMARVSKPRCKLIGEDGNIFNLVGIASRTLKRAGMPDEAKQMCDKVFASGSYSEALGVINDYVEVY